MGVPSSVAEEFLRDIFGKHDGNINNVNVCSEEQFNTHFMSLKEVWDLREQPYAGDKGPQFHNYFKTYQAIVVCQHMHKDLIEQLDWANPLFLIQQMHQKQHVQ